jgi:hypothetical protein
MSMQSDINNVPSLDLGPSYFASQATNQGKSQGKSAFIKTVLKREVSIQPHQAIDFSKIKKVEKIIPAVEESSSPVIAVGQLHILPAISMIKSLEKEKASVAFRPINPAEKECEVEALICPPNTPVDGIVKKSSSPIYTKLKESDFK